jgi:hypothetical protein
MSYGGGTVTQPILGGFDDLTKMLLQGSSEIAQINLQVDKKRNEQMSDLTEQISKITSTGITQHDKLIQQGARDRVNRLAAGFEATKRGEMTLSQNAAQKGQYQTEMGILANMSKLQDENLKNVYKNIEDGKYDSISGDQANILWYNNPGDKKDVYSSPAVNLDGTPKIVGGKQQYVRRPSIEGLQVQDINGVLNVVKIKEVPKRDPQTGDPIVIDGVTQTINKTFYQPLTEALDPSKKYVKKYDLVKDVKDFQSITGTRVAFVDKNGTYVDNDIAFGGKTAGGALLSGYTIAPQNFPDMISSIEKTIEGTSDDEVISIIHSYMGGKADFQPDYEPPRSKKETNESMMMDVVVGGETTTLPRYYDINGNVLKFTSDPLDLQTDSRGKIQITDEQRDLAKAFKRDKMLKSFNVTYKEYKDNINEASGSKTPPTGLSFAPATYASQVPEEIDGKKTGRVASINKNTPIDQSYIQSQIKILATGRNEFSTGTSANANKTRELIGQFSQGIELTPAEGLAGSMKILNSRAEDVIGGFSIVAEGKNNKPGGDVISKITQDLKGTTVSGGQLKSVSSVFVFEQGKYKVDGIEKKSAPMVVIQGKIDLASTTLSDSMLSKQGGSTAMSAKQSIAVNDFYIVETGTELRSLYTKLWDQGNTEGSFRKVLEDKGYNIKGIMKGGNKPDLLGAFEAYTNIINN